MQQLKRVKLLGAAGRRFGREFLLAVNSPAEAVRALVALFPAFHGWILEQHERGVAWRVVADDPRGLSAEELPRETGAETIVFAPVILGAGGTFGKILKVVLGIALVAVGLFVPGIGALGVKLLVAVGASLALGGIGELLTKTPTFGTAAKPTSTAAERSSELESNLFSRNQGTGGQGECVPLLYGRRRVQSPRVVSFNLQGTAGARSIDATGTRGLLGYVNGSALT